MRHYLAVLLTIASFAVLANDEPDPFLWLEEIDSERSMTWVSKQNAQARERLTSSQTYSSLYDRFLSAYDSAERIAWPGLRGEQVYNFWRDKSNPRGILRRTSLQSYKNSNPQWETVLNVDALAESEGEDWVYKGSTCLSPEYRLCMLKLSRGGADASEFREFDTVTKTFVDGGFHVPEAKGSVAWQDADTLWVSADWGEGSLTESGYPRFAKEWRRDTPFEQAKTLLEINRDNLRLFPYSIETSAGRLSLIQHWKTTFTYEYFLRAGDRLIRLDIPVEAELDTIFKDQLLVSLRSDWVIGENTYPSGSLVAVDIDDLLAGKKNPSILFEPSARISLGSVSATRNQVLVTTLDNVTSRLYTMELDEGVWVSDEVSLPGTGAARVVETSDNEDLFFFSYEGFLKPDTLYVSADGEITEVQGLPEFFDSDGLKVTQHEATSRDGTKIPYFLVAPADLTFDGSAPTILNAYGGFEVSRTPYYSSTLGSGWLERSGVYVLANIRGGGEFGPAWHQAAMGENHIRNFEDFIAVAEDLVARKVTSPAHLGIMGGSQGGLLVGGSFVLRPDLFNAVVSQVPLLDMKRYTRLLAGASWIEEYGDPDKPEDWAFMREWSPYQLVKADAEYPEPFIWTTTRDDRVHPGHARKMAAKMQAMKHPVLYFENTEGGHGAGSTNAQSAEVMALQYAYLWRKLGR